VKISIFLELTPGTELRKYQLSGIAYSFFVFRVVGLPRRWRNTLFRNVNKCISIKMTAHRRRRKCSTN